MNAVTTVLRPVRVHRVVAQTSDNVEVTDLVTSCILHEIFYTTDLFPLPYNIIFLKKKFRFDLSKTNYNPVMTNVNFLFTCTGFTSCSEYGWCLLYSRPTGSLKLHL